MHTEFTPVRNRTRANVKIAKRNLIKVLRW